MGTPRRHGATKTRPIYVERYKSRAVHVTQAEAQAVLDTASVIYAVEQGEIEIPSYEHQRRLMVTMRFEQILPRAAEAQTDKDAR